MSVNIINELQQSLNVIISTSWSYPINWFVTNIIYYDLNNFFLNTTKWINNLFFNWANHFLQINSFNNFYLTNLNLSIIQDLPVWTLMLSSQSVEYYSLTLDTQSLITIKQNLINKIISYNFVLLGVFIKYMFVIYLSYFILIYTYFNTTIISSLQNSLLAKFLHVVESEEELGSLDDAFLIIFFFLIVFGWFFGLTLCYSYFFKTQLTLFGLGFILLVSFILLTPLSALLDFGISFATYIRGASAGSNLLVECIFDIIGTLVVFTRFVVQNIRFVLIFFAYFELFEWTYNSNLLQSMFQLTNFQVSNNWQQFFSLTELISTNLFLMLSLILTSIISYLYYLVHLLILIFVQVTIYLLISFWLFFFFYTSFTLNKVEKLFMYKKN